MASVEYLLLRSLKELVRDELREFQWRLQKDHEHISKSDMEDTDRFTTVDMLMNFFGAQEAVTITVSILRKMKQNHLAEQLQGNV
uniref:Si:dkey-84h14.4 n=1 Tax=Cyprinus carpio TaxID=7962 RepID=A0A8C1N4P5_CYPCA